MKALNMEELRERYEALWHLWRPPREGAVLDWMGAGIWDPEAHQCVNNHYSLSHMMLAAGLLAELTDDARYDADRNEMAALLTRHQAAYYAPYDRNTIHWDFNNLAWLNCGLLSRGRAVAQRIQGPVLNGLHHENGTRAGNWLVMRRVNHALRGCLRVSRLNYRNLMENWLQNRLYCGDGGIDEFPGRSRPIQYHTYVLALMLRRALAIGRLSTRDEQRLIRGTEYLLAHLDPCGNGNYRGRGQYQLFFEGCARYVLSVLMAWYGDNESGQVCAEGIANLDRQTWPMREDGLLSLVRTDSMSERFGAYYDYHYVSVYNAFDLAWRLLGEYDRCRVVTLSAPRLSLRPRIGLFPESGLYVAQPAGWLLAITAGEDAYLSDVGLTVCHLGGRYGYLFTAPGGPHPGHYGSKYGSDMLIQNVFSPLAWDSKGRGLPHFNRGTIRVVGTQILLSMKRKAWQLHRRLWIAGSTVRFEDYLLAPGENVVRHIFHWALPNEMRLDLVGNRTWAVIGANDRLLARLHVLSDGVTDLHIDRPFRGPGGMVRPHYIPARGERDHLAFALELEK